MTQRKIIRRECRFATHIPETPSRQDAHIIKELVTYSDGAKEPSARLVHNYERDFHITKEIYRNHEQKKEMELLERLQRFTCTQSELVKHLHRVSPRRCAPRYGELTKSPYVYGSDVSSTSLIKYDINHKDTTAATPYTTATMDIETDVVWGTKEVIVNNSNVDNHIELGILSKFLDGIYDPQTKLRAALEKYLGDDVRRLGATVDFKIHDDEYDVISKPFEQLHEKRPDFLTFWNMKYDVPFMEERCNVLGKNIEDLWRDPKLPKKYGIYNWTEGVSQITTDSGVVHSLPPSAQWHSLVTSASFTAICSMTTYRQLRLHKPIEPSYSLDAIMMKELKRSKLKFKEADHLSGLDWHQFMQEFHPIEYCIYAVWDTLGFQELVTKLKDLSTSLPISMDYSDFMHVKRRTKRNDDNVHFGNIKRYVSGTLGVTQSEEEETEEVMSLSGWIITTPAYKQVKGIKCIKEYPKMTTGIRLLSFYLDIISAYPSGSILTNLSKATTDKEICHVKGAKGGDEAFKYNFMNDLSGPINSQQFCEQVYGMDTTDNLMDKIGAML